MLTGKLKNLAKNMMAIGRIRIKRARLLMSKTIVEIVQSGKGEYYQSQPLTC
jgi:hypothetical protein